ncbi:hypothetical protein ACU6IJ_06345 [Bacillus sp. RM3]|uniref:hypothetical protein n=1 Tax=Bacillus sp. RM3 TaxID=410794 RepID=UPI00406C5D24
MNSIEIFKELTGYLKIPSIVVTFFVIFSTIKPISFISAGVIEQKFFSKDKLFVYKTGKCILVTVLWMFVLYSGATFILIDIYVGILFTAMVIAGLLLLLIYDYNNNVGIDILNQKIRSHSWLQILMIFMFFALFLCFYIGFYKMFLELNINSLNGMLVLGFVLFIVTLPIPFILKPISEFGNWYTYKVPYWLDNEGNKWYIIHPLDRNVLLLGDNKNYNKCKETMILKKEDIHGKKVYIEEYYIQNNELVDDTNQQS